MSTCALALSLAACDALFVDPRERAGDSNGSVEVSVTVPAGYFYMGCNEERDPNCAADEKPQHRVYLGTYGIDLTEVTVEAYAFCVEAGDCDKPLPGAYCNYGVSGREKHPVNCVTWLMALEYCAASHKRLPTEAEWEMSARGGCDERPNLPCKESMPTYPWGEDLADCENATIVSNDVWGCGQDRTFPVGSRSPSGDSPYELKDMAGNVWEWVADAYAPYPADDQENPFADLDGPMRVIRGGAFSFYPNEVRASARGSHDEGDAAAHIGFRCAVDVQ